MSLYERALTLARRARGRLYPPPAADEGLDLAAPGVVRDPYPHYAALRRAGPVHFLPRHGFWIVVGYDEVSRALRTPEQFPSARKPPRFDPVLNEADPPAHTRVRRTVAPAFTPAAVSALEGHVRACAAALLDEAGPGMDLVEEFAVPLTERVAGALLALPPAECEALRARLHPHRNAQDGRMFDEVDDWARTHAADPGPSLAARLFQADANPPLSAGEVAGLVKLLWFAAITTTGRLIPAAALRLLLHPEARERVAADRALVPALVDEAARMDPPEQILWRLAGPDAELGGVRIPPGAEVRLCVGAANRDPARFPDPDRFILGRDPSPHLTFGAGPHFCPGMRLARLQATVAIETLLERWPHFQATEPLDRVEYVHSTDYRALTALRVVPGGA